MSAPITVASLHQYLGFSVSTGFYTWATHGTSKNQETGKFRNLCPVSRKPLKMMSYGNLRNLRNLRKLAN